jgi:hypothetical protein
MTRGASRRAVRLPTRAATATTRGRRSTCGSRSSRPAAETIAVRPTAGRLTEAAARTAAIAAATLLPAVAATPPRAGVGTPPRVTAAEAAPHAVAVAADTAAAAVAITTDAKHHRNEGKVGRTLLSALSFWSDERPRPFKTQVSDLWLKGCDLPRQSASVARLLWDKATGVPACFSSTSTKPPDQSTPASAATIAFPVSHEPRAVTP